MDLIAKQAGVTKPTLYAHFGSKDTLFESVARALRKERRAWRVPSYEPGKDAIGQLLAVFSGYLDKTLTPGTVKLGRAMLIEATRRGVELPDEPDTKPGNELERWLQEAADSGALQVSDTSATAVCLWAIVHGRFVWPVLLGIRQVKAPDRRKQLEQCLSAIMTPMLRDSGR